MNVFMLMMGGSGTRFGSDRPKQYTLIHGRPLFSYITERADRTDAVGRRAVVSHPDWLDYAREWCEKTVKRIPFTVTEGGDQPSEEAELFFTASSVIFRACCLEMLSGTF